MLYPPERFDMNEWFVLCSAAIVLAVAFLLPKRFSPVFITVIVVLNVFLGQTVDYMIAVEPYDFYDISDSSKYEITDVAVYYVCYPPVMYIFLHFYSRWRLEGIIRILYVIGAALLTTFLEWLADLSHVFTYKGWHLWYSPFVYAGVYALNILMLHFTESLLRRGDKIKSPG